MGFVEDKQELIEKVGLYEVLNGIKQSKTVSKIASVRSKSKNLLPYMIDLLSATCKEKTPRTGENTTTGGSDGSPKVSSFKCEASRILIEILVKFWPELMRILKRGIIQAIKAGLFCGDDFTLPNTPIVLVVKLQEIDYSGLLKQNPYSEVGRLLFGKSPTEDFNLFLVNLLQNGGTVVWKNLMKLTYIPADEELRIELTQNAQQNIKFDDFLANFINSYELINRENAIPRLLDSLTGVLIVNSINSLDKIIAEEKTNEVQRKIRNSDPCVDDYKFQDNFFEFTNDELLEIEKRATERSNGAANLDLGCGVVPVSIDLLTVTEIYDNIQNAPPDKVNLVIEESVQTINRKLTENVPASDSTTANFAVNAFLTELMAQTLTNVIFEPKFMILQQIANKIVNGPITTTTPNLTFRNSFDYTRAEKVFFEYVSREVGAALLKIVYEQLKKEILSIIQGAAERIIKELADLRYKAVSSVLTGVVNGLSTKASGIVENFDL